MSSIPTLEAEWRAAAETQAEAKQAFDETVHQLGGDVETLADEPAFRAVASNLAKAIANYHTSFNALQTAVREMADAEWPAD